MSETLFELCICIIFTTLLIACNLLASHISFHFSNPSYHSLHRFDANFRIYLSTSVENQLFPNVCIILTDRRIHVPLPSSSPPSPVSTRSSRKSPASNRLVVIYSTGGRARTFRRYIYTYICIYKCVQIFRESGIRDPFLFGFSVSSRSNEKSRIEFRHLRFHRILLRFRAVCH